MDSFDSVMTSPLLVSTLEATMLEGVPMCSDCAFLPYCGADPVFHRATQGDIVGHKVAEHGHLLGAKRREGLPRADLHGSRPAA